MAWEAPPDVKSDETASACMLLDAFEAHLATLRAHLAVQEGKAAWIS